MALNPQYHVFEVPKANGTSRLIEAPSLDLKEVQRQFSRWLQCVYFIEQTDAAYGYIMRVKDVLPVKNILENARQHLGAEYLLNVDFQDFFHQIGQQRLFGIFQNPPFRWTKKAAALLAKLFTRNGRLPMGAPTSPVLSNLAAIPLDKALKDWADTQGLVYTRFVDDLSFSSKEVAITPKYLAQIKTICLQFQFDLNPRKIKWYAPENTKEVTGLVLNETVDISPTFYHELNRNLKRLKGLSEVAMIINQHREIELYRSFKKEVQGMVNFIGMIEGYGSQLFYDYRQKLKLAVKVSEESLSARWTNSNYF
jgi:RNA-directed DNA polymerase